MRTYRDLTKLEKFESTDRHNETYNSNIRFEEVMQEARLFIKECTKTKDNPP